MKGHMRALAAELSRVRAFMLLPLALVPAVILMLYIGEQWRFADDNGYRVFTPAAYRSLRRELEDDPSPGETIARRHFALKNYVYDTYFGIPTGGGDADYNGAVNDGADYGDAVNDGAGHGDAVNDGAHYDDSELDRYTGHPVTELALYAALLSDMEAVLGYRDYLDSVMEASETMSSGSIFATGSEFQRRNAEKTADDYRKLYAVVPMWEEPLGVDAAVDGFGADWLGFIGLMVFAAALTIGEKPSLLLPGSTKLGRTPLRLAKIVASAVFAAILSLCVTLACVGFGGAYYGLGDLGRPVQSIKLTAPFTMSAGKAIAGIFALRCLGYVFWAELLLALCRKVGSIPGVLAISAALLGVGALLGSAIAPYSYMNVFKYINPYTLLSPGRFLFEYVNLNIFGHPARALVFIVVALTFLTVLFIFIMLRRAGAPERAGRVKPLRVLASAAASRKPRGGSVRILRHEHWRLYIGSWVLAALLGLSLFQALRFELTKTRITPEEGEYRAIVEYALGLPPGQRRGWAEAETARLSGMVGPRAAAIGRLGVLLDYLEGNPGAELVYETGWNAVMGEPGRREDLANALVAATGAILAALPLRERALATLVRSTKRGRGRLTTVKLLTVFGAGAFITIIAFTPTLIRAISSHGLGGWGAPSYSIPDFAGKGRPLWALLAGFYSLRLLGAWVACVAIYAAGRFGVIFAMAAGFALFVLPPLLGLMLR